MASKRRVVKAKLNKFLTMSRFVRRRRGISRSRIGSINVHRFMRWGPPNISNIMNTNEPGAISFQFDQIINNAEFDALYDRYKITKVVVEFQMINIPEALYDPNTAVVSTSNYYPRMWYVKDYDDSTIETLAQIKERAKTKSFVLRPNKIYKIAVKPAVLGQTYRTAVSTGYAPMWNQWIDMAQKDVPHYGLKWVFDTHNYNPSDTTPFRYNYTVKYYFTCKDVR